MPVSRKHILISELLLNHIDHCCLRNQIPAPGENALLQGGRAGRQGAREGSPGGGQAHIDEPPQELDGSNRDCHSATLYRDMSRHRARWIRATGSPSLTAGSLSSPGGMLVHSVQRQVRTGQHRVG